MERLAKVAGTELRLGELLAAQVAAMDPEDEASASLCRRAGQIYAKNGRNEEALALLRQALAFEPDSPQLFQDIDALLREVGTAEERVELCEATLEHRYDPRDQLKLLHTIADLQENQLEDVEAAISAHQRALELDETHETTLVALTRLYEQAERWNELVELYERRADMAGPMEGAPLRILLADLHMRRLRAHEPALDQLEEIVRDRPDYQPAIERLEAMRASEGLRERVVDLLRPIYQEQDDWRKIILLNEDRFALADDSVDQVAILRETAELWELRGEDPVRAQRVLSAALELQPEDEEVRAEVERLAAITEDWQGLAALYAGILETHTEMLGRQEMVLRLARLHDEKLDDPRQALLRYQEARAVDETDGEIVDAALRLSLLLGDWTVLEQLLVVKADMVYDDIERSQFLFSLGALRQSTLGDADSAILAFERAFETDEQNMAVCDRLIELYEARGEPGRLVDLYIARVEGEGADDDHQFSLLTRAAELLETALSDNGRAIECLVQALAVRPGEVKTTTELNRLYRTEKMWPELLDNLRLEAGVAEDAEHRLRIRHDIARILAYEMESYEEALEAFAVILDEKPDDEEAIDAVFSLVEREEHMARQASDLLVPALRQTPLRSRLVKALTLRLSDEQEPHTRVETLRTIAQVQEEDLDDPAAAFETYLKAISETVRRTRSVGAAHEGLRALRGGII
jgi:tetratricopeptide (TPR) repeat protein